MLSSIFSNISLQVSIPRELKPKSQTNDMRIEIYKTLFTPVTDIRKAKKKT
ncbi:MAG TPA: hypothetical protein PKL30_16205 [Leptospiraceae bacterium]|nr:hypothetical protein [Leptospiraceae bacterium]HMY30529.1 hypothetical protein [Leptospiraceae bacterium]HMZ64170.1 hypothetical protein [Leptospiraceae bacterium]HNA06536.1 hypothetical protein [Leptospiraceae bacterium]HNC01235.1 hypothetical protein [Leptospiraceae bacterium]